MLAEWFDSKNGGASLCGVCLFVTRLWRFFLGAPVSPSTKTWGQANPQLRIKLASTWKCLPPTPMPRGQGSKRVNVWTGFILFTLFFYTHFSSVWDNSRAEVWKSKTTTKVECRSWKLCQIRPIANMPVINLWTCIVFSEKHLYKYQDKIRSELLLIMQF